MVNTIVGAGVVGLPFVFLESGIVIGLVLLVGVAYISDYTMRLLVHISKIINVNTFEEICDYCFGSLGYYSVNFFMFILDYGAMLSYLLILGDSSEILTKQYLNWYGGYTRELLILLFSFGLILPLSLFRDMSGLEAMSGFSIFTILIIIGILIYICLHGEYESERADVKLLGKGFWSGLGVMAFTFVPHD
eukprot:UN24663